MRRQSEKYYLHGTKLYNRVCGEVQHSVHLAISQFESERRYLMSLAEVRSKAEKMLINTEYCGWALRHNYRNGKNRDVQEILKYRTVALNTDLWTQALLLQYDPLAREIYHQVNKIMNGIYPPQNMYELMNRFHQIYPSGQAPLSHPYGTLTFTEKPKSCEVKPEPTTKPKKSWAEIVSNPPSQPPPHPLSNSGGTVITKYHFPSQAHWASFRLYAYDIYKPLVENFNNHDDNIVFVEQKFWGKFSNNLFHAQRIYDHIISSLEIQLTYRADPPSPDQSDEMVSSTDLEDLRSGLPPLWAMTPSPSSSPSPRLQMSSSPDTEAMKISPTMTRSWADMCDD